MTGFAPSRQELAEGALQERLSSHLWSLVNGAINMKYVVYFSPGAGDLQHY